MKKQHLHSLTSFVLGACLTLGYAPWSLWFLVPFILTAFLALLKHTDNSGQLTGFAFGLGWFGAGISWVHVSIEQFGGLPLVGSLALMALLCAYLALFPALAFAILKRHVTWEHWWFALPVLWFITEWLRGWVLTGFPWLSLGYTQTNGPIAAWAPVFGETGVSMLLVMVAALLARFADKRHFTRIGLVASSVVVGSLLIHQVDWTHSTKTSYDIVMVQGNIKQELRWVPEQDLPTMRKYLNLTEPYWNADIIIWPEAAVPRLEPLSQHYLKGLDAQASATNTGLITGIVNYNFETQQAYNSLITLGIGEPVSDQSSSGPSSTPTNTLQNSLLTADSKSAIRGTASITDDHSTAPNEPEPQNLTLPPTIFDTSPSNESAQSLAHEQYQKRSEEHSEEPPQGQYYYSHSNRYSKHHLLPIGEFIPLENWLRGLAPIFDLPMSSFHRGDYEQTNLLVNGAHFVPAICFEIAFPQQIRANLRQHSDFIITVSNDAWFGDSHGPHQHLEIARMRAIELGIPVLRATNNGVTAFINRDGSVASQAPQFEDAAIQHRVFTTDGITPYRYFGETPHWIMVLFISLYLYRKQRQSRQHEESSHSVALK